MVIMGWGGRCGAEEGEGGNKSEKVRLWPTANSREQALKA